MVEANSGVVAPYVTADLATFYEACFVQNNAALVTVATTLLDITAVVQTTVEPNQVCVANDAYHPLLVTIAIAINPPAL